MKKFIILSCMLLALLSPVLLVRSVAAVDVIDPVCKNTNIMPDNVPEICKQNAAIKRSGGDPIFGPNGLLSTVVNILSVIGAFLAVIVIIIGGTKMVVSSGDANSVASARRTVLYAVISLAIIGGAQLAVRFIINQL